MSDSRIDFLQIHPDDNVIVAVHDLPGGMTLTLPGGETLSLREVIPAGHKAAIRTLHPGDAIIKYGMPIGSATTEIAPGNWIHTHNLKTRLGDNLEYTYHPNPPVQLPAPQGKNTFRGFVRADGSVGIRNELWIIPTVGCVNRLAENLAAAFNRKKPLGNEGRARALTHPAGCSQLGEDHAATAKILAALARHPNAGGVLIVALGCENNTLESFKPLLGNYDPQRVRFLKAQDAGDEFAAGLTEIAELRKVMAADQRSDVPLSKLVVGLKCGGSDGFSGITANPLIGRFSDLLLASGGTSILTEVPEMFGAETLLFERAVDRDVFNRAVAMINDFKTYFRRYGQTIYENPSPGNKAGGISSLEEKSLGCTQKGGSGPVTDVLLYGDRVRHTGLNLLTGPGNDMVATTVLTAAGAQLVLFSTGRGTPFGGIVPTVKVATNSELARYKSNWIDFNAGALLEGVPMAELAREFFDYILAVASGERESCNEINGYQEIALFKDGVTL